MTGGFIYPVCPNCENKASAGRGVSLTDVADPPFEWGCRECGEIHTGVFEPHQSGVDWLDSREPSALDRVKRALGWG